MTTTVDDVPPVERVAVGQGTPEGTNSAYLLPERGVVIDPGPPTESAWTDLRTGLERASLTLEDVRHVLVTHWHADHAGLAPRLAEAADATLAMGDTDAPIVADYAAERERRLERDAETMRTWGAPDDAVAAVLEGDRPSPLPDSFPVERLADGDRIAGLEVLATPGHTLGHVAFAREASGDADADTGAVFVGDAVLPTYTPNVGGSDTRTRTTDPLGDYFETLSRLERRPEPLLPGHGTTLAADRIEEIRTHHHARTDRVVATLESLGPVTPWAVACELFGDLSGIHVKFGAGEVAAHLEALEAEGMLERVADDPVTYERS